MIRNKKVIVFGIVFVALSVISVLSAKFLPIILEALLEGMENEVGQQILIMDSSVADSYVQYISNFSQIGIFLVGILFATAITKEKDKGTYDSLKMNRVKDSEIVFSYLVSQIIVISLCYFISVSVFVLLNILCFRQIMGLRGLVAILYIYLLLLITVCFVMFVSCFCKKNRMAYLIVILSYFGVSILEVLPRINKFNPYHLITIGYNLMYYPEYSLKEHLVTSLFTLMLCVLFVFVSLLIVKNKINNKKVETNDNAE